MTALWDRAIAVGMKYQLFATTTFLSYPFTGVIEKFRLGLKMTQDKIQSFWKVGLDWLIILRM